MQSIIGDYVDDYLKDMYTHARTYIIHTHHMFLFGMFGTNMVWFPSAEDG